MFSNRRILLETGRLLVVSVLIGLICGLIGYSLKRITEHTESILSSWAAHYPAAYFILPGTGFALIFFLRQRVFKKKQNKGIKEIYDSLKSRHAPLPFYKIPSHYINGFLTVISGGSTGIEVSTVVAAATVGTLAHEKGNIHIAFRKELICAAVASGVTILFGSPVAGLLFAYEVISRRISPAAFMSMLTAVASTSCLAYVLQDEPPFHIRVSSWHYYAIPYFILLGILAGLQSVYLTRSVLLFKKRFAAISSNSIKIILGVILIGTALWLFPQLYGEGYQSMNTLFAGASADHMPVTQVLLILCVVLLLKPLVTAATLSAGGDGGVFAPSLFIGALLGLVVATVLNRYFGAGVIPMNFMVLGMAAVLSGSLHAPLTAVFLVCGLTGNYILIVPILIAAVVAKLTARFAFPYTVYSYVEQRTFYESAGAAAAVKSGREI